MSAAPADRPLRLFVGLPLPQEAQQALDGIAARLAGRLRSRIGWTKPGNWHLTLKFLGDVAPARTPELLAALAELRFAAFALRFGGAGSFPPVASRGRGAPRVLWAGVAEGAEETRTLAAGVERVLAPLGFAPEARPFAAHLTLGRVRDAAPGEDWAGALRGLEAECWPACKAEAFVLYRSVPGPAAPRYEALGRFPAQP